MADEEVLPQGRGGFIVTRSAKGVHRPAGPWTPTVHAFLEHLTAQGFDGAPMPLGFDDSGREVVSWIEGEVLSDPEWEPGLPTPWPAYAQTEEVLVEAGDLIRRLHEAAATFRPPTPIWKQYAWPMLLEGEIVCHGDLGPHNSVYRDGHLVGLIDWDAIRPNGPDIEFANAAWHYVPLADDEYFARSGFGATPDVPRRLRMFAEAYGIDDPERILWALQEHVQRTAENLRYWHPSPLATVTLLGWLSDQLRWLDAQRDVLHQALRIR